MAYRPKRKYATGGSIDPLNGIGLRYTPVNAEVPNLDAARFFLEEKQKQDAYMEQERLKRKPSRAAVLTSIANLTGTEGQKKAFSDSVLSQLDEYDSRARQDPNWVFSTEGQDQFAQLINSSIDPARVQQLKDNYTNIQAGREVLVKNNMLDAYQVNNGNVMVRDNETGVTSEIPLSMLDPKKYTPVTGAEIIDQYNKATDYNPASHRFYSSIDNTDRAIDNLLSSFDTATGSYGAGSEDGYSKIIDNIAALSAAKRQAIRNLSPSTVSSLQEKYIRETGGKYNQKGFDKYVESILDNEIRKRRQRIVSTKPQPTDDDPSNDPRNRILTEGTPTYQNLNTTMSVTDSEGIDSTIQIHLQGTSVIPPDTQEAPLNIDGSVWSFGGESQNNSNFSAERNKDGYYGSRKRLNKTYEKARHISNSVIPVTTGEVFEENGIPTGERIGSGLAVIKTGEDHEFDYGKGNILDGTPVEKLNVPYTYKDRMGNEVKAEREIDVMRRTDGKYVQVKMSGVKVYKIDDDGTEQTLMVPVRPDESLRSFGVNLSPYNYTVPYFSADGRFSSDPLSEGQILLATIRKLNPKLFLELKAQIDSAMAGGKLDYSARVQINETLNYLRQKIEEGTIRNTFSIAKPEHTKKDESDFIR